MIISIHQPNYLPWLGYFYKILKSDVFVFLDDVQYTKGGYINRVSVAAAGGARWLTIPVRVSLGQAIQEVGFAKGEWKKSHLGLLRSSYSSAPAFRDVWADFSDILNSAPEANLAASNMFIIQALAERLGLTCSFRCSSEILTTGAADDRLIEIVKAIDPAGTYLSGKGAEAYQNPEKFKKAGLGFIYTDFKVSEYFQASKESQGFVGGLSVVDAIFNMGWTGCRDVIGAVYCE